MRNTILHWVVLCSVITLHAASAADVEWGNGTKALLIGGGTHHDYDTWFNKYDTDLLEKTGRYSAKYVESQDLTPATIESADIVILSANKNIVDSAVRKALFLHVEGGGGLIVFHAGLWYSWSDWPEFNRDLAGGGARGHNRFGNFGVKITKPNHSILKDVPSEFEINDELYWFEPDPKGPGIETLATAWSEQKMAAFPQVFIVKNSSAKIVGLTLGHDGKSHELPAFQKLFINSADWVSTN